MTEPERTPAEQKQLDELLAKLDGDLRSQNLHPILKHVLPLMHNEEGIWYPQGMPLERVDEIKKLIDQTHREKTIIEAITDLLKAAAAVGQMPGGKMAGAHLLRLCNDVIIDKNLIAMVNSDPDVKSEDVEKATQAVGGKERPQPAKIGEKPPEGSVRVDQLPGRKPRL